MIKSSVVSLLDQALWAMTNFVAIALAARTLDHASFGVLSLGFSVMVLASGLGVAMAAEVVGVTRGILIRRGEPESAVGAYTARALGAVLFYAAFGTLSTAAMVFMAARATHVEPATWWIVAICPLSVMAEGLRALLYARRRIVSALAMSISWVLAQAAALAAALMLAGFGAAQVLGSWCIGALVCTAIGAFIQRAVPAWRGTTHDEWRRRWSFGLEYLATAAPAQLLAMIAAPALGIVASGSVRAMQTVYGPLNIVLLGLRNAVVPAVTEETRQRTRYRAAVLVAAFAGGVTVLLTLGLLVWPGLGRLLMGDNWPDQHSVLAGYGLGRVAASVIFGAMVIFRASDRSRTSAFLRIASAAALVVPFAFFVDTSLDAAMWASGVASLAVAALWWVIATIHGLRRPGPSELTVAARTLE